jgi:hypothetical protein
LSQNTPDPAVRPRLSPTKLPDVPLEEMTPAQLHAKYGPDAAQHIIVLRASVGTWKRIAVDRAAQIVAIRMGALSRRAKRPLWRLLWRLLMIERRAAALTVEDMDLHGTGWLCFDRQGRCRHVSGQNIQLRWDTERP